MWSLFIPTLLVSCLTLELTWGGPDEDFDFDDDVFPYGPGKPGNPNVGPKMPLNPDDPSIMDPSAIFLKTFAKVGMEVCKDSPGTMEECARKSIGMFMRYFEECDESWKEMHMCVIGRLLKSGSRLAKLSIEHFWTLVTYYRHIEESFMGPVGHLTQEVLVNAVRECETGNYLPSDPTEDEVGHCLLTRVNEYISRHHDFYANFFKTKPEIDTVVGPDAAKFVKTNALRSLLEPYDV